MNVPQIEPELMKYILHQASKNNHEFRRTIESSLVCGSCSDPLLDSVNNMILILIAIVRIDIYNI